MPMPLWWGQVNKRIFNPRALNSGKWDVITHVGRSTGATHRTPLDAHEVNGTFVFILVYGSRSDWVQNVIASGSASLETGGEIVELSVPRLLDETTAWRLLVGVAKPPPGFLNVTEFLQLEIVNREPREATAAVGGRRHR